jgi:uncharacterized membrane protein YccF (DUF307 family)
LAPFSWAILPIGFKPVPIPPEEATSDLHRPGTTYNTAANVIWLVCFGWLIILSLVMAFISNIITIIGTHPHQSTQTIGHTVLNSDRGWVV